MQRVWIAACLAAVATACGRDVPPGGLRYGPPRRIATLAHERITESSGLACSRRRKGVFWTHNDSGGGPRVYALDRKGRHLATLHVPGARARDWEDMASFRRDGQAFLLLADVGDNSARRRDCRLYVVPEPAVNPDLRGAAIEAGPSVVVPFVYSDGPRDCEAVGVDAGGGKIYLVSKRASPRKVYALPLPDASPETPLTARPIAELSLPQVTGMDISPDGRRAAIVTYSAVYQYARGRDQTWAEALAGRPGRIGLPLGWLGESIAYGPEGRAVYLTREGRHSPLLEIPAESAASAGPRGKAGAM